VALWALNTNAAFAHPGLTTTYRTENVYRSTFVLSNSRNI